ncbi:hypothetical protein GCM10020295_00910 [Streptomyces cinereospinus]
MEQSSSTPLPWVPDGSSLIREPDWRPSEWQPDLDLFNGRSDSPATRVRECSIVGCSGLCTTEATCCSTRANAFTAGGPGWEEFLISHTPRAGPADVGGRAVRDRAGRHSLRPAAPLPTAVSLALLALEERDLA